MVSLIRVVRLLLVFCVAIPAYASPLWFNDQYGLHQINTETNQIVHNLPLPATPIYALVLNQKDSSLWALGASQLSKYAADGSLLLQRDLKTLSTNLGAARKLALDPNDDSVWLAGDKQLFHLDSNANLLGSYASPAIIQDIALVQDQTLWVLAQTQLLRYSAAGLLQSINLEAQAQQSKYLVIDDTAGVMWLGGAKQLIQRNLTSPTQTLLTVTVPEVISALTLAPDSNSLWVAGQSILTAYGKNGSLITQTDLKPLSSISNIQTLVYDAASASIWLGHSKGISRFSALGQYVLTLPAAVMVSTISTAPSGILPRITLIQPTNNGLTNNPRPPIRYQYDALCFGQPCGYPPAAFSGYQLTSLLNGQSIGKLFTFDAATAQSSYTPLTALPEGANTLSAYVTDSAGRRSQTINSSFSIDSIPPRFVSVSPANGTHFLSPNITIQGSIDDPQGVVVLENLAYWNGTGANPATQNFNYLVTLKPGVNTFNLSAIDKAGNITPLQLTYSYSFLTLALTSPLPNASIDNNSVTVTGSFDGSTNPTITVNGVAATLSGTTFSATVPLIFGSNLITVSGSTPEGATATQTVTVNSTFPSISITSPVNGANPNDNTALVTGIVQAPANASFGVVVNGVVALVDATNHFYANNVPLQAGANTLTATVTTLSGKTNTASIVVTSSGSAPATITLSPEQGIAPLTVSFTATSNTGKTIASWQASPGGVGSYDTTDPSVLFKYTYTQPGTYLATVTVTDSAGVSTSQTLAISVQDPLQMDQMFTAMWSGMNTALIAGDKTTALTYLNSQAQAKYGPVFDVLIPNMANIVASYSPLKRSSLSQNIGEYAINRTINGVNRIFFIYFLRGGDDGVWRIDTL